ncbi:MAG: hypothetical protein II011_06015 [Prevotella sp.]|nr:hypothetical protein [Prevotella sp.]
MQPLYQYLRQSSWTQNPSAPGTSESDEALQLAGNIRELENVIEYLTICSSGTGTIDKDMLQGLLNITGGAEQIAGESTLADSMEQYEIEQYYPMPGRSWKIGVKWEL